MDDQVNHHVLLAYKSIKPQWEWELIFISDKVN